MTGHASTSRVRKRYSQAQVYRLAKWLYDRYALEHGLRSDIPFEGRSSLTIDKFVRLAEEALEAATDPEGPRDA